MMSYEFLWSLSNLLGHYMMTYFGHDKVVAVSKS